MEELGRALDIDSRYVQPLYEAEWTVHSVSTRSFVMRPSLHSQMYAHPVELLTS